MKETFEIVVILALDFLISLALSRVVCWGFGIVWTWRVFIGMYACCVMIRRFSPRRK